MPYIPDSSLKHTSVNMHFDVLQWDRVGMCVTVAVLPGVLVLSVSLFLSLPFTLSVFIRISVVCWAETSNMDGQIHNKHTHQLNDLWFLLREMAVGRWEFLIEWFAVKKLVLLSIFLSVFLSHTY